MTIAIRRTGILVASIASVLSLNACAGSGEGGLAISSTKDETVPKPEVGQTTAPVLQKTVARVELGAPSMTEFLLRATIPLPKGVYPNASDSKSFGVIDHDGTLVPAQVEIVSRYPREEDGADIVEILARVTRNPQSQPGDRIQFEVAEILYDPGEAPTGQTIQDLLADGMISQDVLDKIANPSAVHFRSRDVFGNVYSMDPFHPDGGWIVKRLGSTAIQVRSSGAMRPAQSPAPANALPQLFAVHAYITGWGGENALSLDVRFHNGWIGSNPLTPAPLSKSYYKSLEILVPKGWKVQQAFADANLGAPYDEGAFTVVPLVKQSADGKMHVLPHQTQHERRLVIGPPGTEGMADFLLRERGLAFALPGTSSDGTPLYSWWNPATARYFSQKSALPRLDFTTAATIRAKHATSLLNFSNAVATGTPISPGDEYIHGALGIANPGWIQYGGGTGGSWITALSGATIAWAASREGYQYEQLRHRMQVDRQASALYREDGEPASLEDFLKETSSGMKYTPFEFDHTPLGNTGSTFFGLNAPANSHVQAVANQGLQPSYEQTLYDYQIHDFQHLIRFTRGPKILATLGNDAMAKDDIQLEAELFRLSYSPYPHNSSGGHKKNSMLGHKNFVLLNPAKGVEYHRGEAWGTDAAAMAYGMGSDSYRAKLLPWFQSMADIVRDGQAGCGRGSIMAMFNAGKIYPNYRGLQTYEECFVENALRAVLRSVLEDKDPAREAQMRQVLEKTYLSLVSVDSWPSQHAEPHTKLAVGPQDPALPIFCTGEIPPDGTSTDFEKEEIWIGLYGGLELTNNPIFFQKAQTLAGGTIAKLKTALETSDDGKLANSGWMLAKMQQLGWSTQP